MIRQITGPPGRIDIHYHRRADLAASSGEIAWRKDLRRVFNDEQYLIATNAALAPPVRLMSKGYLEDSGTTQRS